MLVFDTHQYIKRLINVGVPPEQAEVHAEELKTIVQYDIATKQDVEWSHVSLKKDLEATKAELKKDIELAKTELKGDIALLRWLMGLVLGGIVSLIVKTFFG